MRIDADVISDLDGWLGGDRYAPTRTQFIDVAIRRMLAECQKRGGRDMAARVLADMVAEANGAPAGGARATRGG